MRFAAGVDVGSTQTKAVMMEETSGIVGRALVDTGANVSKAAENAFRVLCTETKVDPRDVGFVVGTGYGRYKIAFGNAQMTEISCHARGAHHVFPNTRTVIDMGGQDSKAIRVGPTGEVLDFVMNDKCAAGTGRFLANAADVLSITLDEIGPLSITAVRPVKITTVCTVFVESDILSYLGQGRKANDILGGVHQAIAKRTVSLARRIAIEPAITVTGGVARNTGMVKRWRTSSAFRCRSAPIHTSPARSALRSSPWRNSIRLSRRPSMHTAAIDIGTGFTKAVILSNGKLIGRGRVKSGVDLEAAAGRALALAVADANLAASEIAYTATTGFGRYGYAARDIQITEITSAAAGAHLLFPESNVVLDIGNQATRAIALTPEGKVKAFKTNDKCAAGSGSFIVRAAKYLQVAVEDVGNLALQASSPQPISSVCAVLAESEIINLVSAGVSVEDILRGIYDSLAERAATLLRRAGLGSELTFIGGVARQQGMVKALQTRLGVTVNVPQECDLVCATGAALLGWRRAISGAARSNTPALRSEQFQAQ